MRAVEPDLRLRRMVPTDLPAAAALVECFDRTLTAEAAEVFRSDFDRADEWPEHRYRMVAEQGGNIVGTMGYGPGGIPGPGVRWTDWLIVAPDWRRRGIASLIYLELEAVLQSAGCRKVFLDVGTVYKQPDAIAFHARHGYRIEGILQDYWGPDDDLVIMAKPLLRPQGMPGDGRAA